MLSQRMQIQALANRLAGIPSDKPVNTSFFVEPWLSCWLAIESAESHLLHHALNQALARFPERERILQTILSVRPGEKLEFPSLHAISPSLPPIEWLWPKWIPLGMVTILGACQGTGKSFVALDLAYRIIHSLPFPDGTNIFDDQPVAAQPVDHTKKTVLYLDAEATPSILDERAKAYQLDRTRLYVMLPDLYDMIDLNTQKYKDLLIEMISSVNPTLVIIDSLSSIHTNGQNNVEDVRKLLHFLASVADHFHIAILLITHIRKPGFGVGMLQNDVSIEDITGSAHITRVGRSVIGMNIIQTGPVLDPNGPRQFKMLKSNIGEIEKPLSFEFAHFQSKGVYLKWNTQLPGSYKQPTKTDECATWLIETLTAAGRPLSPKFLIEQSEVYGFSRRTLYRARESLSTQIRNTHDNNHPDNTWQLIPSPSRSGDLYRRDGEGPGLGLGSDEESFDSLSLEGRGQGEDDHSPLSIDDLSMGRAGEGSGLGSGKDKKND